MMFAHVEEHIFVVILFSLQIMESTSGIDYSSPLTFWICSSSCHLLTFHSSRSSLDIWPKLRNGHRRNLMQALLHTLYVSWMTKRMANTMTSVNHHIGSLPNVFVNPSLTA